jgi:hypothetical protein
MKQQINEIKRMQQLAGIINEEFDPFLDTNMGGWIKQYIDDVVEDSMDRPNGDEDDEDGIVQLDPKYRPDFDTAFDSALSKFSQERSPLYMSDDSKLAPEFIESKGIGFVMDSNKKTITPKIIQIFNNNYGVIDINYIKDFFSNTNNWKEITDKVDTSNYNKLYLIDTKNNEIGKKESFF